MIPEAVVLGGAVLILLAGVGVVRFDDVLTRMHALTKASTLGLLLVLVGAAVHLPDPNDITSLALAAGLQLLTSPVSAHLIGRATYRSAPDGLRVDVVDQFAQRHEPDQPGTPEPPGPPESPESQGSPRAQPEPPEAQPSTPDSHRS